MNEYKKLIRFLILSLSLCITWLVVYDVWLHSFDDYLTLRITDVSVWVLRNTGFAAESLESSVYINSSLAVYVGPACNGMVLMALFAGFILAFPGPPLAKLLYIPFGIIIINLLNVMRIGLLALNAYYSQQTLDFNHKYTFTIVVYSIIFGLWMFWVKKFSAFRKHVPVSSAH